MSYIVMHNPSRHRFEMEVGDGEIAFVDYTDAGTHLILTYSEVPERYRGRMVGHELVKGTLARIREAGQRIVPQCGFVAAYVARHPEVQDLVVTP